MPKVNMKIVAAALIITVAATWVYGPTVATAIGTWYSATFGGSNQGAVSVSGTGAIQGNNTPVATGVVAVFNSAGVLTGSATVSTAAGWTISLNPGTYTGYWIATGYYPATFSFTVLSNIGGTRTQTVSAINLYPISVLYSFTFGNSTTILATKTNAATSNSTLKTHISYGAVPYTLTVAANSPFSQMGYPQMGITYPGRETLDGNYVLLYLSDATLAICTGAVWSTTIGTGKLYVFTWASVTSSANPATGSTSITITATLAGNGNYWIQCYQGTNLAEIQKNSGAYAALGWTLTTYTLGTGTALKFLTYA
jgi:hypothetical protein